MTIIEGMEARLARLESLFETNYGATAKVVICSPGRAEIIGNHTDYNCGFALAAAINCSFLGLFRPRDDQQVRIISTGYPQEVDSFAIANEIPRSLSYDWSKYARGVAQQLCQYGCELRGADILLDSTVPVGGVSSSAAYELTVAAGLIRVSGAAVEQMTVARLCQQAENDYVGAPCGFLDQGTILLGRKDRFVYLDFKPSGNFPVSETRLIPAEVERAGLTFVLVVDRSVKRELGSSGYPARRQMCEASLPLLGNLLNRSVSSLREVSGVEFDEVRHHLEAHSPVMRKRVEHVIYENERVQASVAALQRGNFDEFGQLLTASGVSALSLYELDDHTPELTFLFNEGREQPGIVGIRNMGGGFSALVLALVETEQLDLFKESLASRYQNNFKNSLEFIPFTPQDGLQVLKG